MPLFAVVLWVTQAFEPVFDPNVIDAVRATATAEVNAQLDALSPNTLEQAAAAFFATRDASPNAAVTAGDRQNMVQAYRTEQVLLGVHAALRAQYPDHVLANPVWLWNNVGGIYARLAIIACGIHEYVALFGTSMPQQGFSGYYPGMEVFDIMVTGSMLSYGAAANAANPLVYTPGGRYSALPRYGTRFYTMDAYTYMIDYGRGAIPAAFWDGVIAPYLFTNEDWESFKIQLGVCAAQVLPHLTKSLTKSQ